MAKATVKISRYRRRRAVRAQESCGIVVMLSPLRTGRLYIQRLSRRKDHCAAGRIKPMKNPYNLTGNRIRDLPACSAVPQPNAPPQRPILPKVQTINKICTHEKIFHNSLPFSSNKKFNKAAEGKDENCDTSFPLYFYFISNCC
jgi:hypothetical protein